MTKSWNHLFAKALALASPILMEGSTWAATPYVDLGDPLDCPSDSGFWMTNGRQSWVMCNDLRDDGSCDGKGQNGDTTGNSSSGCCGNTSSGEKEECDTCRDPEAGGGTGANGESPSDSSTEAGKRIDKDESCRDCQDGGMPMWSVEEPLLSVRLVDIPMWYRPSYGPKMALKLHYKSLEGEFGHGDTRQPNVFGFGPGWSTPWRSYIRAKEGSSPAEVWVIDGVGNVRRYTVGSSSSNTPYYQRKTGAYVESWTGPGGEPGYVLTHNNGAKDIYGQEVENASNGAGQGGKIYFLSRREDATGRALVFNYSGTTSVGGLDQLRLTDIVDAAGLSTTFTYTNVGSMNSLIHKVTNPHGFSAMMTYDASGRLDTIVDSISLTNKLVYDGNDRVTSLKTPYGTNRFEYISLSDTNCLAVRVIEKEVRKHLFVAGDLPVDPWPNIADVIVSLTNYVHTATNSAGINAFFYQYIDDLKGRDSFALTNHASARCSAYWGPLQYQNLPSGINTSLDSSSFAISSLGTNAYNLGHTKRWRRAWGGFISNTKSLERYPGGKTDATEAGPFVFYAYDMDSGQQAGTKEGFDNLPSQVFKQTFQTDPTDSSLKVWDLKQIEYYGLGNARPGYVKTETELERPNYPEPPGGSATYCIRQKIPKYYHAHTGCIGTGCNRWEVVPRERDTRLICGSIEILMTNWLGNITYPDGRFDEIIVLPWDPGTGGGGGGPGGTVMKYDYDPTNKELSKVTYQGVAEKVRTYNAAGQLQTESFQQTTGAGVVTLWTRNWTYLNGFVRTYTDERGMQTTYDTDPMGRVTKIAYPDSTYVSNRFDRLDLVESIDRNGFSTKYVFNAYRRLLFLTNAINKTFSYTYCNCGSLDSSTDGNGQSTSYSYDNRGRRTLATLPGTSWTATKFDEWGHATNILSSGGVEQKLVYNLSGQIREKWLKVSGTWKCGLANIYDADGQLVATTNANGIVASFEYDQYGRSTKVTYADGSFESNSYNTNGISVRTDAAGNSTTYGYDQWGRLQSVTSPLNQKIAYARSAAGDVTYLTNENQKITQWVYDQYGRVLRKLDHLGSTNFVYTYDPVGRLTAQQVPPISGSSFLQTTYTYDRIGNVTNIVYPTSGLNLALTYDGNNKLLTLKDAVLGTTTWTYTVDGTLASEDGPWADDVVSYTYGADRRLQSMQVAQGGASSWIQSFLYDSVGRLDKITNPMGSFHYDWTNVASGDWIGSLVRRIELPFGNVRTNSYDAMGRLITTAALSGSTILDSYNYVFTNSSRIIRMNRKAAEYSLSNHMDFSYDLEGQLTSANGYEDTSPSATARVQEQFAYSYDAAGNLTQRNNGTGAANQLIETFTPDALNQLVSVARNAAYTAAGRASPSATSVTVQHGGSAPAATRYADGSFARQGITLSNGNNSFIAVATDSLSPARSASDTVTVSLPASVTLTYDSRGNLSNDGKRRFVYNDRDELVEVYETNKWRSAFTYDGLRRMRIRKEYTWTSNWSQTGEVRYVYSGMLVAQERNALNQPSVTYTRGLDKSLAGSSAGGIGGLLARYDHGSTKGTLYHCDFGGNITALFASNLVWARYSYDPYGNLQGRIGPLADANCYRFSSKEFHGNSGLIYYGYRFYDPNLQRWPNRDPIGETGGLNLYAFVANSPVNLVDMDGRAIMPPYFPPTPPGSKGPEGFSLCQRDFATEGIFDFMGHAGNLVGGEHVYVQYLSPNGWLWGWGFALPGTYRERHFRPNACHACRPSESKTLQYGPGAGMTGSQANPEDIRECITRFPPSAPYVRSGYNCKAWAKEAADKCGLDCNNF